MMLPIVYAYPSCRWDMVPGRHRYLMEAISSHVQMLFLDWPRFTDSYTDVFKPSMERMNDRITVIHNAFGLRFARGGKRFGRVGALIDGAWLNRLLRAHGVDEYVYWLSAASVPMLWGMRTERLVYDCIDPCFDPAYQRKFDRAEEGIARRAKIVFATAESLLERMLHVNPNSFLLPNACSELDYEPDVLKTLPRPAALAGRAGPVIGYMGTFDWRVDTELLGEVARRLPGMTFALVGRVNGDQEARVGPLRALSNVVLPGSVSVEEGRAYVAAFDVGIIPFIAGEMGDAINPVKMHMYLMAGKPVVTTWLRECRRYAPYVQATASVEEFVTGLSWAVAQRSADDIANRVAFARRNSWSVRAAEAMAQLEKAGLLSSRSAYPKSAAAAYA